MNKTKIFSKLWFPILLLVAFVAGCAGNVQETAQTTTPAINPDTTAPTVSSTAPANGAVAVPYNRKVSVAFSEAMDPASLSSSTFTITGPGVTPVPGKVTPVGSTASFIPTTPFTGGITYTGTITTGAKDQAGNALAALFVWSFTTSATADATAPTVITTGALNGATGLPVNRSSTATFSEQMDPATLASPATSFTVKETLTNAPVTGVVTYSGSTASFKPAGNLKSLTQYTSTISSAAKDLAGNALVSGLVPNPWSWTTGNGADNTAPTVTITNPANLATNVPVNTSVNATFSEPMDTSTMLATNISVKETVLGNIVQGTVAYDVLNNIATFSPLANLKVDTSYTVTVTNGATDLAGNALVVPSMNGLPVPNPWTFRTTASIIPPQALAINLRTAGSFGIASRAGLTSTGVTVVNGDVALTPLAVCIDATGNAGASQPCLVKTYSSPTGMSVNGSLYWAGDPFDNGGTATSVTNDLNLAWVEGKAKVPTKPTVSGDQLASATPYLAGVYHNATLGLQAGGSATLDAQNDANAIFIFQVDSSFVDSGTLLLPTQIKLINGAQARNVWFVTGLDITIGSGTTWNGNILAGRTAVVNHGSTVTGRVLAGASGAGAFTITGAASPSVTTISVPQ